MSKQLTLFGKRAIPRPYFSKPTTNYEKFVNKRWVEKGGDFGMKKDFLDFVLKEWGKIQDDSDALEKYISKEEPPVKIYRKSFLLPTTVSTPTVISSPASTSSTPDPIIISTETPRSPAVLTLNVPNRRSADEEAILESREHYLKSHLLALIKSFFTDIEFYKHDDFFTDHVLNDEGLIKTMTSVSYDWTTYSGLKKMYISQIKFEKRSRLREGFVNISEKCNLLRENLTEISKSTISPTIVASLISIQYLKKAEQIKHFIVNLGIIQTKISDKNFLSNLRRRLKQQGNQDISRGADELPSCVSYNNTKLKLI